MCVGGQRDDLFAGLGCFLPKGAVNLSLMLWLKSRRVVAGRGEFRERKRRKRERVGSGKPAAGTQCQLMFQRAA